MYTPVFPDVRYAVSLQTRSALLLLKKKKKRKKNQFNSVYSCKLLGWVLEMHDDEELQGDGHGMKVKCKYFASVQSSSHLRTLEGNTNIKAKR